ncbi:hypothetical protein F0562_020053 [Nyssa sinensis]|uniref:DUF538 domain-containing protein n=1 Tax=Nyssa sinensis TaxID=561372 RepID=A0A5J5BQV3_9ASTE|nr:hypothetical protein F0562_020053 [Nyssa sinensis]
MSLITEEIKAKAEVYYGDEICQEKSKFLLTEMGLPNGLLPLSDMEECGYVKETGFVWLKQKKKTDHKFEKIGRLVSYGTEVTAIVEPKKIKKLTGVKTKELLVWVTLCDIYVDDPPTGKITFKTPTGLFRTFPVSAFEIEEVKDVKEVKETNNGVNINGSVSEVKEFPLAETLNSEQKSKAKKAKEIMSLMITEEIKAKAEVYYGDEICQEKSKFLLTEMGLPNGLLPLSDMEECGYVKETGFVWLKQKKKTDHKFEKIGRLVSYGTEVTAIVEPKKIKKLTGVKTKELLVWVTLCDIYVDDPPTGKITFKILAGLVRSFPVSAFEIEEVKHVKEVKESNNGVNINGSVNEVKEV